MATAQILKIFTTRLKTIQTKSCLCIMTKTKIYASRHPVSSPMMHTVPGPENTEQFQQIAQDWIFYLLQKRGQGAIFYLSNTE